MSTIIVTGGAGFIGSNFVRYALSSSEDEIVVLDSLTYAGHLESLEGLTSADRFRFVHGDITDRRVLRALLAATKPRAIINFAAESHVDRSIDGPGDFVHTNIVGTFELLEAARCSELGSDFRFVHVSTDEVFGSLGATGLFSEQTPYAPNSPYAASKAGADHLVRAYFHTYGLSTIVTNCSNNYGPYQFPEKLVPLMILNAIAGKPLPIYGNGQNVRDWLYVDDHCAGIWRALQRGKGGECYTIGGNSERTNIEVVDTICDLLDQKLPAAANPALADRSLAGYRQLKTFVADRPGHDQRYAIDSTKIRRELGWSPSYDFESGMSSTVDWYLAGEDWCNAVQGLETRQRRGLET